MVIDNKTACNEECIRTVKVIKVLKVLRGGQVALNSFFFAMLLQMSQPLRLDFLTGSGRMAFAADSPVL